MATQDYALTPEQVAKYHKDGYLVIPDFFDGPTRDELLQRAKDLLSSFSMEDHPRTKFTTEEDGEHVGDDYFLESGDKIRYFFEVRPALAC